MPGGFEHSKYDILGTRCRRHLRNPTHKAMSLPEFDGMSPSDDSSSQRAEGSESVDFNTIVPLKSDVSKYFEILPDKVNNTQVAICTFCKANSEEGGDNRIIRIKNKPENLRKHLKNCKYFCAAHKIPMTTKPPRPLKPARPDTKSDDAVTLARLVPPDCRMVTVKLSRRAESMDVTPGMTGSDLLADLKEIFNVGDDAKCFLRREAVCPARLTPRTRRRSSGRTTWSGS